jgi:hypothetical protein
MNPKEKDQPLLALCLAAEESRQGERGNLRSRTGISCSQPIKHLAKIPSQIAEAKKPGIGWESFVTLKLGSGKGLPLL